MPAVATRLIDHVVTDASGKPIKTIHLEKGDVLHDDADINALLQAGHHASMTHPPHNDLHCPSHCPDLAKQKGPSVQLHDGSVKDEGGN